MAQTMQQVTERITEAQAAINVEIENLAAALGVNEPRLAPEYSATQYEQIATHLETTARALAKVNQSYTERLAPDAESHPAEDTAPRATARRPRSSAADVTNPIVDFEV